MLFSGILARRRSMLPRCLHKHSWSQPTSANSHQWHLQHPVTPFLASIFGLRDSATAALALCLPWHPTKRRIGSTCHVGCTRNISVLIPPLGRGIHPSSQSVVSIILACFWLSYHSEETAVRRKSPRTLSGDAPAFGKGAPPFLKKCNKN